jgi:hypothetical protein
LPALALVEGSAEKMLLALQAAHHQALQQLLLLRNKLHLQLFVAR